VISKDGAPGFGDFLEDERASEVPDEVIQQMENAQLKESLEEMSDRERHVLVRRYGLDGLEPATLAELGNELGITRSRVRQLQRKAERDLRGRLTPDRWRRDPPTSRPQAGRRGLAVVDALDEQTIVEHTRAHDQGRLGRMIGV
jgi:DNA-directed RNA polymerase sigma subunit (sigma70/sigma32)